MSNVSLVDVRACDGEPWDVAEIAAKQTIAAIELALQSLDGLSWAARNAWLSQEYQYSGNMPEAKAFGFTPQNRKLDSLWESLRDARDQARIVGKSASIDPRI